MRAAGRRDVNLNFIWACDMFLKDLAPFPVPSRVPLRVTGRRGAAQRASGRAGEGGRGGGVSVARPAAPRRPAPPSAPAGARGRGPPQQVPRERGRGRGWGGGGGAAASLPDPHRGAGGMGTLGVWAPGGGCRPPCPPWGGGCHGDNPDPLRFGGWGALFAR